MRKRSQGAAQIRDRRFNVDCAREAEGRGGVDDAIGRRQEDAGHNIDITAVAADCARSDLTLVEDHRRRINYDIAAAAQAPFDIGRDFAVIQPNQVPGFYDDVAAIAMGRRGGDRAVPADKGIGGLDADAPSLANTRALCRNCRAICQRNLIRLEINFASRTRSRIYSTAEDPARSAVAQSPGNQDRACRIDSDLPPTPRAARTAVNGGPATHGQHTCYN